MSRYSDRAKRNMRRQINAQIRLMRGIVIDKYHEWQRVVRYRKYHLPGQAFMERATRQGWKKAWIDLGMLKRRKAKLNKEGKI